MDVAKNFAKVIVVGGYEDFDTEITLEEGHGARLPDVPFNAVWWNATDFPDPADDPTVEIVRVTDNTDDVITIERAQESTGAQDHNEAGKTYQMVAGLTAKVVNEDLVGDVHGSGPALVIFPELSQIVLRLSTARMVNLGSAAIEVQSTRTFVGDFNAEGNNAYLDVDDGNNRLVLNNLNLATTQSESASGPVGTVVGKLAIRDGSGSIIGYLPIYDGIT